MTIDLSNRFGLSNFSHGQSLAHKQRRPRPKSAAACLEQRREADPPQPQPAYCALDKKVLRFFGHFEELVGHTGDVRRIRHAHVLYYLEDDTISVVEPRIQVCTALGSPCL